jgi:hypothetical protein
MKPKANQDAATALTVAYLQAIENRFSISWAAQNQPVCIPDRIDTNALRSLKEDLDALLLKDQGRKAIDATRAYGPNRIQTVGFGLTPDFDQFIKLGFLYGDRVVLWDFLSNRLLLEKSGISNLTIAKTACELLLLRPAVERGAVVILPHPVEWSDLAEMVAEDLKAHGRRSAAEFGLSMALCAVEEGLPLHPFTLLRSGPQPKASPAVCGQEGDLYSKENYVFQEALSAMLSNQRFAYLQNVSASEFQRIVAGHQKLRRRLRGVFNPPSGMSQQQEAIELQDVQSDLAELVEKQNCELLKYGSDASEAGALFINSLLAKLDAVTLGKTAIADVCIRLAIALRRWFSRPGTTTIVQAFQALQRQEGQELVEALQEQEQRPATAALLQPDVDHSTQPVHSSDQAVEEARAGFWAAGPWTEDKHDYLLSLPVELAAKVLKGLTATERHLLVNHRKFQESYITEYLGDLWEIDKAAFWKHLETMFLSPEGLVVGERNEHIEIMSREDMPKSVWLRLLKCLLAIDIKGTTGIGGYFTEMYSDIVQFQTTNARAREQRRPEFRSWFQALNHKDRDAVLSFLRKTFNGKVPAWVRRQPH